MVKRYYALLRRDRLVGEPWRLEFGDCDRSAVVSEMADYKRDAHRYGFAAADYAVVRCASARKSDIESAIEEFKTKTTN